MNLVFHSVHAKIVIAHRGASGYLPEHTLPAKAMAYAQGADYLEQDVVVTKDDQLVVLHDHYLDRVTDVAQQFPHRARADGRFYVIDFTLDEIRKLHVTEGFDIVDGIPVQRYPQRFPIWKSIFRIHTLAEEIEFIQGLNHSTGKNVGIYPEIKSPWFHHHEGKDISVLVLNVLKQYGYTQRHHRIYLQCFDPHELQRIKTELQPKLGMDLPLIQLITYTDDKETFVIQSDGSLKNYSYDWMFSPGAMEKIARYADGIGPKYTMLLQQNKKTQPVTLSKMVEEAHAARLHIHPYVARADRLPDYVDNIDELFNLLYQQADVDGVFTDFPDKAVQFLQKNFRNGEKDRLS